VSQIERQNEALLEQLTVIEFQPERVPHPDDRGVHVIYGDISNVDYVGTRRHRKARSSS